MLSCTSDLTALAEDMRGLLGEVASGSALSSDDDMLALARDVLHRVIGLEVDLG